MADLKTVQAQIWAGLREPLKAFLLKELEGDLIPLIEKFVANTPNKIDDGVYALEKAALIAFLKDQISHI